MVEVRSPFPPEFLPRVWAWIETFRDRVCDDFAPVTCREFVAHMLAQRSLRTWGVWRDGDLGGLIAVEADSPYRVTAHAIFARAFWGRETTLAAMRGVYRDLFASGVEKVMMFPYADNHQVRAFNRMTGAVDEGILRAHTLRGGKPVDVVAMALFKEAFYVAIDQQDQLDVEHLQERTGRPDGAELPALDQSGDGHRKSDGGHPAVEAALHGVDQPQLRGSADSLGGEARGAGLLVQR